MDAKNIDMSTCEDPDDDKFNEFAIAGTCDIIVSGDRQSAKRADDKGIRILKPNDFVKQYLEG